MGKKNRGRNRRRRKQKKELPLVSICTPTFNRRPFFPYTIKCFLHQDYPKDKLEWIIIDDGTDLIEDIIPDISNVHYFKYNEKMTLGKKRNLMHEKSKGDIIVYMDDDDYYPPERVSHAVDVLTKNNRALCAGSSEIYIWFNDIQKMVQFGPYGPKHATAGTFAFKRKLLQQTSYEETASLAEEKHFLKNYTIPFAQLNPLKTILVFSHEHNTFDKRKLLNNPQDTFVKESSYKVEDFVKEPDMKHFYMETINELLKDYEPGQPKYKPDVIKQTKEIEEYRRKMMEEAQKNGKIIIQTQNGENKELNNSEIVTMLRQYQAQLKQNSVVMKTMQERINNQQETINAFSKEKIMVQTPSGEHKELKNNEIIAMLQQYQAQLQQNTTLIRAMQMRIKTQEETINSLQTETFEYKNKIQLTITEKEVVINPVEIAYVAALSKLNTHS